MSNSVDAKTTLTGASPGAQLRVENTNAAAGATGLVVTGASSSATGSFQNSSSGTGVFAQTAGAANAALVAKNTGGGPAGAFVVNAGVAPFTVSSTTKVGGLNADQLDGLDSTALQKRVTGTCVAGTAVRIVNADGSVACQAVGTGGGGWSLTGTAGTSPGANFLGTSDNQPLELKVDGQRALRLEPNVTSPNVIGGRSSNTIQAGATGVTIAGGGAVAPNENLVSDNFGTVGGGSGNVAGDEDAGNNPSTAVNATVGGGTSNTAGGHYATVGGGFFNTASGYASAIAGGFGNRAAGLESFAAGTRAKANHLGAFVWADGQNFDMASSGTNQFIARAQGHFFLQSDSTLDDQSGFINTSTGAFLSTGGTWTNASSRSLKAGFAAVSPAQILEKVASLPLTTWHYRAEPGVRHIGPVSEDFHHAFGVGENARSIGTVDADGVALAAIQGLYRQNTILQGESKTLRAQLRAQGARLTRLERAFARRSD